MRILLAAAITLAFSAAAFAQGYQTRQSPHFGYSTLKLADDFHLTTLCTVSGGTVQERAQDFLAFAPVIGSELARKVEAVTLADGEAACGLKHHRGTSIISRNARTKGFTLNIKTWADGSEIGGGKPWAACNRRAVNFFGLCYERIELVNNDARKKADGVSACIETELPETDKVVSLIAYAGAVPDAIKAAAGDEAAALSNTPCASRDY
ncbi:hypothetical protein [Nitratireductor basaltis]|uniref:Uncharacterized protein n=1 Tax=Nitratireductor basaltis TaxID=472175 RepID=A0A084UB95_9HYPH|nr:hypothetical protein [Nitratireductor basaltis]KFB10231.1 hypothetical protein EL18_01261 [Nitratireductor basaltis]